MGLTQAGHNSGVVSIAAFYCTFDVNMLYVFTIQTIFYFDKMEISLIN